MLYNYPRDDEDWAEIEVIEPTWEDLFEDFIRQKIIEVKDGQILKQKIPWEEEGF